MFRDVFLTPMFRNSYVSGVRAVSLRKEKSQFGEFRRDFLGDLLGRVRDVRSRRPQTERILWGSGLCDPDVATQLLTITALTWTGHGLRHLNK